MRRLNENCQYKYTFVITLTSNSGSRTVCYYIYFKTMVIEHTVSTMIIFLLHLLIVIAFKWVISIK